MFQMTFFSLTKDSNMLILMIALFAFGGVDAAAPWPRLTCYYTNWAQYRPDPMKFFPEDIDANMCTHIIYAFANLVDNHLTPFEYNDDDLPDCTAGMYSRVMWKKNENPDLKVLLAVGGWNMGSPPFEKMTDTPETRADFIYHSIGFLRDRDFDGLDLDWEYPIGIYKEKFTELVTEMRAAYEAEATSTGKPRLLITAATPAGEGTLNAAYEIDKVSKVIDFFNVMTYDLAGSWNPYTGHHTNLYSAPGDTGVDVAHVVDYVVKDYQKRGAPKDMIVVGTATYGRTFALTSSDTGLKAPAQGGASPGDYTRAMGFWSYYEVCTKLQGSFVRTFDNHRMVPYAASSQESEWVGYEEVYSMQIKADYIMQNGLGGGMVWALDLDDFKGYFCNEGSWPLLTALKRGLHGAYDPPVYPTLPPEDPNKFTCTGKADGVYSDPDDCSKYYICYKGNADHLQCTAGQLWNDQLMACDVPANVNCGSRPIITPGPTDPIPTVCVVTPGTTQYPGEFTCFGRPDGLYSDPSACNMFYECGNGIAYHKTCPGNLLFHDVNLYCDFPENVNCGSRPISWQSKR